jgi:hypothetical protein
MGHIARFSLALALAFATGAAPAGPDYWVGLSTGQSSNAPQPQRVPGGWLIRATLVVGNSGAPGHNQILAWVNAARGSTYLCDQSVTLTPPTQGHAVDPVAFQVFYPAAGREPVFPKTPKVTYDLRGTVAETLQPYEDQDQNNNVITVSISVPEGGQASCVRLGRGPTLNPAPLH